MPRTVAGPIINIPIRCIRHAGICTVLVEFNAGEVNGMAEARRRAVAVGFSRGLGECAAMLEAFGYAPAIPAASAAEGLGLIRERRPELVLSDAVLPGGDGVALARQIRALRLDVQPALLVLKPRGMPLPGATELEALCALAIDAPASERSLGEALERLEALEPPLPPEKAARLEALLDALGVPDHPGREDLTRAVALVWADRRRLRALRAGLYARLSRDAGRTPAQVERAIRHVIDAAWRTGDIGQQHRIFGDTIDARRGKPTCGEMIAQLADILRWEG